ncbi:sensor histidine kinase [Shewanella nanhaiensis]|uniref:histidine kinase n=1 Tax=Shewanella nanhaiensis TaxID=2864872 RepID=A0ABS7DZ42_9GAMM|nr:HAMP domain-containing sensor histidine kinase [Shewanella nanhaiensis]MBW8182703.1 HAMP domain-containing histidine kinase [Shewanella nanhaiensis]
MPRAPRKKSSVNTMTSKLSIYFAFIAIVIGATLFVLSQAILYWLEDELNRRTLQQNAETAIVQFKHQASSPLIITNSTKAYNRIEDLPQKYHALTQYPLGFLDEIHDAGFEDLFFYHTEYTHDAKRYPLLLIMDAENVELSSTEWRNINLVSIIVMLVLFVLFGYAITKLARRLITPVTQLSQQLKSTDPKTHFSVPDDSATEFTELASSLNYYRSENELLIRQEQAFAKYASHELRTPLTIIQGATKLLELDGDAKFHCRQRERIAKAATDMNQTIEALLSLVKHEQSEDANYRVFERAEIEQIIEYLQPLADSKSITVKLVVNAEPKLQPSRPVMRMLLSNLLSNAINASDPGLISVEINKSEIRVLDQGSKISEQTKQEGHGLGLLIVDALCQRYNWRFSLVSREPNGSIASLNFNSHLYPNNFKMQDSAS